MKKRSLVKTGLFALVTTLLVACGEGGAKAPEYDGSEVQGVSETEILIGNTAASTGNFAAVGVPFNVGLNAALKVYNDAGGFNGKTVKLKTYDDEFNAEKGLTLTKQLVEEDKVFALVGHFGTNTVGATLDYIKYEKGVPMVYAATGISGLYNEKAQGYEKAVMSVQPIYDAEGRVLLARAVATTEGGYGLGGTKIGVISTKDDAGKGMLAGIKKQAKEVDVDITYVTTDATPGTNHASAVNTLKTAGCDVIIVAANQAPFKEIMQYMKDGGVTGVKVITSYVSANATDLATFGTDVINADREVYTTAWLDINDYTSAPYNPDATTNPIGAYIVSGYQIFDDTLGLPNFYDNGVPGFSAEYWSVAEDIVAYDLSVNGLTSTTAWAYSFNSYALAGYIAGATFVEGLKRVQTSGKDLTWKNYIDAMEKSPIDILMGGEVDYSNGQRLGITDLALNKFDPTTAQLIPYSGLTSLDDLMANVK